MQKVITTQQRIAKYGDPLNNRAKFERDNMVLYDIPQDINDAIKPLPNRVYMHRAITQPFTNALRKVIAKGLAHEIKTWDGCFNVRKKRGSNDLSVHSFGLAFDMNAAWNPLIRVGVLDRKALRSMYVKWSEEFLDCFRSEGFNCGADWEKSLDGMHFQWDY